MGTPLLVAKRFPVWYDTKSRAQLPIPYSHISSKILPFSDVKFFFKCNLSTAAKRRFKELKKSDSKIKFKDVKKALKIRNILDTNRKHSPLLKHRNSVEIDTGKLNKQAMLKKMSKYVEKVLLEKNGNWRNKKYKPYS